MSIEAEKISQAISDAMCAMNPHSVPVGVTVSVIKNNFVEKGRPLLLLHPDDYLEYVEYLKKQLEDGKST